VDLTLTIRTARILQSSGALLLLSVVSLTGCGGSHGSSAPTTSPTQTQRVVATTVRLPPRTIAVNEFEFGFSLSRNTISAGRVTFLMLNVGSLIHNFAIVGRASGAFLVPGQVAKMTVTLKPGTYVYVCGVKDHAAEGMQGTLVVTR
jgi:plastocyanin